MLCGFGGGRIYGLSMDISDWLIGCKVPGSENKQHVLLWFSKGQCPPGICNCKSFLKGLEREIKLYIRYLSILSVLNTTKSLLFRPTYCIVYLE